MNRPRIKDKHLPRCVYHRHGAYWLVRKGKWTPLGSELSLALAEYARLIQPSVGGCDELLDRTLERCKEQGLAKATIEQYAVACKSLKLNLSEFKPEQVKSSHVAGILDHDRNTPNMANRKLTFLRLAFTNALTWGMAEVNPTYGVGRLKEGKRERLITEEEFRKVQANAAPHIQTIMELAYLTGQRIMDVVGIKLADIDESGIYFRQQKTGKRILVRMTPQIRTALEAARSRYTSIRGLTLFHQRNGKPYGYRGIRDAFERARVKAGVEDYRPNDHRAMSLTSAEGQGLDPQKLAGHSTRATTNRYLRDKSVKVVDGPSFGQPLDNWTKDSGESKS